MLSRLKFRNPATDDAEFHRNLAVFRTEIDEIDARMQQLIAERMEISREIGNMKRANNVAFYQHNRWKAVLEQVRQQADRLDLNEEFMTKLFSLIHLESLDIQGE